MGGRGSSSGKAGSKITKANEKEIKIRSDNLPELTGSEKQVAWANDIRKNLVNDYMNYFDSDELYMGVRQNGADIVFGDLYRDGLFGYNSSKMRSLHSQINGTVEQKEAMKKGGLPAVDDYVASLYYDKVVDKADTAYHKYYDQYKSKKAQGVVDKDLQLKAKQARAKVYKSEAKKLLIEQLSSADSASKWIDAYKNTQYNTFYNKSTK